MAGLSSTRYAIQRSRPAVRQAALSPPLPSGCCQHCTTREQIAQKAETQRLGRLRQRYTAAVSAQSLTQKENRNG